MWMGLFFVLLGALPIIYNWYNSNNNYLPIIPMQSSLFQTSSFILFMLSMYCTSSMLPCGRYYYEPEGGYVGNPWVKFSYQYMYLYLGWFIHHLDLIEHYSFQFTQTFYRRQASLYFKVKKNLSINPTLLVKSSYQTSDNSKLFTNLSPQKSLFHLSYNPLNK